MNRYLKAVVWSVALAIGWAVVATIAFENDDPSPLAAHIGEFFIALAWLTWIAHAAFKRVDAYLLRRSPAAHHEGSDMAL